MTRNEQRMWKLFFKFFNTRAGAWFSYFLAAVIAYYFFGKMVSVLINNPTQKVDFGRLFRL